MRVSEINDKKIKLKKVGKKIDILMYTYFDFHTYISSKFLPCDGLLGLYPSFPWFSWPSACLVLDFCQFYWLFLLLTEHQSENISVLIQMYMGIGHIWKAFHKFYIKSKQCDLNSYHTDWIPHNCGVWQSDHWYENHCDQNRALHCSCKSRFYFTTVWNSFIFMPNHYVFAFL